VAVEALRRTVCEAHAAREKTYPGASGYKASLRLCIFHHQLGFQIHCGVVILDRIDTKFDCSRRAVARVNLHGSSGEPAARFIPNEGCRLEVKFFLGVEYERTSPSRSPGLAVGHHELAIMQF